MVHESLADSRIPGADEFSQRPVHLIDVSKGYLISSATFQCKAGVGVCSGYAKLHLRDHGLFSRRKKQFPQFFSRLGRHGCSLICRRMDGWSRRRENSLKVKSDAVAREREGEE